MATRNETRKEVFSLHLFPILMKVNTPNYYSHGLNQLRFGFSRKYR